MFTDAYVHDSQVLDDLLEHNDKRQTLHVHSAYTGDNPQKIDSQF